MAGTPSDDFLNTSSYRYNQNLSPTSPLLSNQPSTVAGSASSADNPTTTFPSTAHPPSSANDQSHGSVIEMHEEFATPDNSNGTPGYHSTSVPCCLSSSPAAFYTCSIFTIPAQVAHIWLFFFGSNVDDCLVDQPASSSRTLGAQFERRRDGTKPIYQL